MKKEKTRRGSALSHPGNFGIRRGRDVCRRSVYARFSAVEAYAETVYGKTGGRLRKRV